MSSDTPQPARGGHKRVHKDCKYHLPKQACLELGQNDCKAHPQRTNGPQPKRPRTRTHPEEANEVPAIVLLPGSNPTNIFSQQLIVADQIQPPVSAFAHVASIEASSQVDLTTSPAAGLSSPPPPPKQVTI